MILRFERATTCRHRRLAVTAVRDEKENRGKRYAPPPKPPSGLGGAFEKRSPRRRPPERNVLSSARFLRLNSPTVVEGWGCTVYCIYPFRRVIILYIVIVWSDDDQVVIYIYSIHIPEIALKTVFRSLFWLDKRRAPSRRSQTVRENGQGGRRPSLCFVLLGRARFSPTTLHVIMRNNSGGLTRDKGSRNFEFAII